MPVFLGGDLNTNTFDGRAKEDIGGIAASAESRRRCLEGVFEYEPLLPEVLSAGYSCVPEEPKLTRRKPLPGGEYLPLRLDWIMQQGAPSEIYEQPNSRFVANFIGKANFIEGIFRGMERNRLPILFVHGGADGFVPPEMTRQAYDACRAEKDLLLVPDAGHGRSYLEDMPGYQRKLDAFLARYGAACEQTGS